MISRFDNILFELIQVAVGTRSSLSRALSADEWAQLRLEFKKQALLGIGYVGVTTLPAGQTPPIQALAQWVHNAEKIRKKNERLNAECVKKLQISTNICGKKLAECGYKFKWTFEEAVEDWFEDNKRMWLK